MKAAAESALRRERRELAEACAETFGVNLQKVKLAEPRRIGDYAAVRQAQQLDMTRRMLAPAKLHADFVRFQLQPGNHRIKQRRLADARLTREHADPSGETFTHLFHADPFLGARDKHRIADRLVQTHDRLKLLRRILIRLVRCGRGPQIPLRQANDRIQSRAFGMHEKFIEQRNVKRRLPDRKHKNDLFHVAIGGRTSSEDRGKISVTVPSPFSVNS